MLNISLPSNAGIGRTVAATVNSKPAQVTQLSDNWLRIEPDRYYRIVSAISVNGRTRSHCL
jgi:formylmethanofuran dehydrogenase subunit B